MAHRTPHPAALFHPLPSEQVANNANHLEALTDSGYPSPLQQVQQVGPRSRPMEVDASGLLLWRKARLATAEGSVIKDNPHLLYNIGSGAFGTVYKAVDKISGYAFAIKAIKLGASHAVDAVRREIQSMKDLSHEHIIKYLGHQYLETDWPEIFMPLREGSVASLVRSGSIYDYDKFCSAVLEQMLSALDFLEHKHRIHRDVKPENILYHTKPHNGGLHFELADFGLANRHLVATTPCGTGCYQAPELWPSQHGVVARQSTKMDVWSLFVTIVAVYHKFKVFPPSTLDYEVLKKDLKAQAGKLRLEPMARWHPEQRASAAQMLVNLFNGRGLTTPKSDIPPIEPEAEEASCSQASLSPATGPSNYPWPEHHRGGAYQPPIPAARPSAVYPSHGLRGLPLHLGLSRSPFPRVSPAIDVPQSLRAHTGGVVKRRADAPVTRARARALLARLTLRLKERPQDVEGPL